MDISRFHTASAEKRLLHSWSKTGRCAAENRMAAVSISHRIKLSAFPVSASFAYYAGHLGRSVQHDCALHTKDIRFADHAEYTRTSIASYSLSSCLVGNGHESATSAISTYHFTGLIIRDDQENLVRKGCLIHMCLLPTAPLEKMACHSHQPKQSKNAVDPAFLSTEEKHRY